MVSQVFKGKDTTTTVICLLDSYFATYGALCAGFEQPGLQTGLLRRSYGHFEWFESRFGDDGGFLYLKKKEI